MYKIALPEIILVANGNIREVLSVKKDQLHICGRRVF